MGADLAGEVDVAALGDAARVDVGAEGQDRSRRIWKERWKISIDGSRLRYYYAVLFGVSFVKGHKLKGTRDTQLISQQQVVVLALSPLFREEVKRPSIHLQRGAKVVLVYSVEHSPLDQ